MMQPLSRKKRLGYLALCFVLFLIIAPVAILYAKGYRLTEAFQITRTGGLYISVGYSGAQIYINGSLSKETGVFQKGALIQNLKPGSYKIRVEKNDLNPWEKELPVFKETVTEARVLMLPLESEMVEILDSSDVAGLFGNKTYASSTGPKIINKLMAQKENGEVTVRWQGESDSQPSYFCQEEKCQDEISIKTSENINTFFFLPGRDDLIIFQSNNGIYVAEIDNRSQQNIQPVLEHPDLALRVSDNTILIKEKGKFYSVAL